MKIFDPLGLVLPTRKAERGRIPWDDELHSNLVADWFTYYDM